METHKERELSHNTEKRKNYLMKRLKVLKRLELELVKLEMTLLKEWKTLTKRDKGPKKSRNSKTTQNTGEDLNDWCRTRPR